MYKKSQKADVSCPYVQQKAFKYSNLTSYLQYPTIFKRKYIKVVKF